MVLSLALITSFSVTAFAVEQADQSNQLTNEEIAAGITASPEYSTTVLSADTSVQTILFGEEGVPTEIKTTVTNGVVKKIETYKNNELVNTTIPDSASNEISLAEPPSSPLLRYSDQWGTWSAWRFMFESYESATFNDLCASVIYNILMGTLSFYSGYQQGVYAAAVDICNAAANYGYVFHSGGELLQHIYKDSRNTVSEPYYYQSRYNIYYHVGNWNNYLRYDSHEFGVAYYPY